MNLRLLRAPLLLCATLVACLASPFPARMAQAQTQTQTPPPAATLFKEFSFLLGSWSGIGTSSGQTAGRSVTWSSEMDGTFIRHSGVTTTSKPGSDTFDERFLDTGTIAIDSETKKYVAFFFFSGGTFAQFDVTPTDTGIEFVARQLVNKEKGFRARILIKKKTENEIALSLELAPPGSDFVPFIKSDLKRK